MFTHEKTKETSMDIKSLLEQKNNVYDHIFYEFSMYYSSFSALLSVAICDETKLPDNGIYEDNYENCVMREYRMAAVRRSILNLCFLHVSSNIRGIQSADGRLSTRLIGESICM